ncbi:MAG: Calx-beta domain-containing protein [Verrucomicrobiota bacterium]
MFRLILPIVLALITLPVSVRSAIYTVVNTNAAGAGSLNQAILDANGSAGADTIVFAITNASNTIRPAAALPVITEPLVINGRSQTGFVSAPIVEINGAAAGAATDGLKIATSNCVISALVINGFLGDQIEITNGANNVVEGCYLGLNLAGTTDASTGLNGVLMTNAANNLIGGLGATNRNYISGNNQSGILIGGALAVSNSILGNVIGLNVTNAAVANSADGIRVVAPFTIIGGSSSSARNIISGNTGDGIESVAPLATNLVVRGNWIGLDLNGTLDRGNSVNGILAAAGGALIGGSGAGEGNLITGNNDDGIEFNGASCTNNLVLGNTIGADVPALLLVTNNGNGVLITGSARSHVIGGVLAGEANKITYNGGDGISVAAAVANTNNTFRGNSLFANGTTANHLGIELGADGVQANDGGDIDTGANQLQNVPVLTSVTNTATTVTINGSLNSKPSTAYILDFYSSVIADVSGSGEGQNWIGSTNLSTAADSNLTFSVTFPVVIAGRAITATATDPFGNTSEFSPAASSVTAAAGQTFTVSNTNNSGAGSLRDAINSANAAVTVGDRIEFNIPGVGVQIISPTSPLPDILDTVTIDGYTQPGTATNSSATIFNATLLVRLDGNSAGAGVDGLRIARGDGTAIRGLAITRFTSDGIEVSSNSANARIEGNVIGLDTAGTDLGNSLNGVNINGSSNNIVGGLSTGARNVLSGNQNVGINIQNATATGNQILGNLIGTDATGTLDRGNTSYGILLVTAPNNTIGGSTSAARNLISGNANGIGLSTSSGTTVRGNFLGTDATGTLALPNSGDGMQITSSTNSLIGGSSAGDGNLFSGNSNDGIEITGVGSSNNAVQGNFIGTVAGGGSALANGQHGINFTSNARGNRIGGTNAAEANVIAFNLGDGISVATGTNNTFRGNAIYSNGNATGDLGIDLGTSGITANDLGDADTGANQQQNFPVLTSALNTPSGTTISGSLNSGTNAQFALDFYANLTADSSGSGQAQFYLGATNILTDANGAAVFTLTLPVTNLSGRFVTATATDTNGNTSEFATNIFALSTVTGTTFTVVNTNDSGPGSLRQAIVSANTNVSALDTIAFAITNPATTIFPASALPTVVDPVLIDGYTQPGSATNTAATTFAGNVLVRIDGISAGASVDGLKFTVSSNTVRGLMITRFGGDGIEFTGGGGNLVSGNVIGLDAAGTDLGNTANGIYLNGSSNNIVGGTSPGARNVISGNNSDGIEANGVTASANTIQGNIIGLDQAGLVDVGNSSYGIQLNLAPGNLIGGSSAGARNLISGNNASGVLLLGGSNNIVAGNYLGTDASGTLDRGNSADGVLINGAAGNTIGGGSPAERNVISGNNSDGIAISGAAATGNMVQGNYIGTDASGLAAVRNSVNGVQLSSAPNNTIGGNTASLGNLISGNSSDGIEITGATAATNVIRSNLIGTDASGTGSLPNLSNGVLIQTSAHDNVIGGNTVAFNIADGVSVAGGTNNAVRQNLIFANQDIGLDLGVSGLTANDAGDTDTGANQLQNFPVLSGATNNVASVDIAGSLDSRAGAAFTLDFYANNTNELSGAGQGRYYLGSTNINTDAGGHADFVATFATSLTGRYVTATATDASGNTSEFGTNIFATSTVAGLTLVVTTTNDSGPGSLRDAINQANAAITTGDVIQFNLPGSGVRVISPATPLPDITDPVTIDGFSQSGATANTLSNGNNATLLVRLDGSAAGTDVAGLRLLTRDSVIKGLAIGGFNGNGIEIAGSNNRVEGCYVGLDPDGTTQRGNAGNGVSISVTGSTGNVVGGSTAAARCVISANDRGVLFSAVSLNDVQGCFIGTDAAGLLNRGNTNSGVLITGSTARLNTVGGSAAGRRNVIAGNGQTFGAENHGVTVLAGVSNSILGNYLGVTVNGNAALGNQGDGIYLGNGASTNFIGAVGAGNVISANSFGIDFSSDSPSQVGNVVRGNLIGTDATGTLDLGNLGHGISFSFGTFNQIGGTAPGEGNVISGNNGVGVNINCCAATSNRFEGNFVGVDITGTNALGNSQDGFFCGSAGNLIGGTIPGAGNIIANNGSFGVIHFISSFNNVGLLGNSIYSNALAGIDLGLDNGPTPNDPGDTDSGPNGLQNYPVLLTALAYPTNTVLTGTLNSHSNTTYRVELFDNVSPDASGYGEGQTYLGFTNVTTDLSGNASFTFTNAGPLAFGHYVSATATDDANNTSEFSFALKVVPFDSVDLSLSILDSDDPAARATNHLYTVIVTNAGPADAASVFLTNTLPAGMGYVSATASQGSVSVAGPAVIATLGTITNHGFATVTLTVNATNAGTLILTSVVASSQFDNETNNNVAAENTFFGVADLGLTISDAPDPVVAGQALTLSMVVSNYGPDSATSPAADFNVDFNTFITGVTASQGSFTQAGNQITFLPGTLPVGGQAVLTVTTLPTETGTLNHYASSALTEFDPNSLNDSAAATTTSQAGPGILQFASLSYSVSENAGTLSLAVVRTGGAIGAVTVDFATSNFTAVAGSDFTATTGTLTFTNGQTLATVSVPILNDLVTECVEQFSVSLFNATGGALVLVNTNTTVTIQDDQITAAGNIAAVSASNTNGPTGDDFSFDGLISADASTVVFASYASNLTTNDANFDNDVFSFNTSNGVVSLVSVNLAGTGAGNSYSGSPRVSASGRYVVFVSGASNLTTNDTDFQYDLFLRDTVSNRTELVSHVPSGNASGNSSSDYPVITPDGGQVAFLSYCSDLVSNDQNSSPDIFLWTRTNSVVELISVNRTNTGTANDSSYSPAISTSGRYVAFESYASDLGVTDTNNNLDVYVRDRINATNRLCSRSLTGGGGNDASYEPVFSADERFVLFRSSASDLVVNDTNNVTDVFLYDLSTGSLQVVNVNTNGVPGNGYSYDADISADGRYVTFYSDATDLTSDALIGGIGNIFLRDRTAGTTVLVSRNCHGTGGGDNGSFNPQISSDGRYVVFESYAQDLVSGTFNGYINIYRFDRLTSAVTLISQNRSLTGGADGYSASPSISTNGAGIVFNSSATDLVSLDANFDDDVFLWRAGAVAALTDLALNKTASTNTVLELGNFTYTLAVTNQGGATATGVSVTDSLPAGVSFVSAIASQGTVTNSAGIVTAALGSLNIGSGATVVITVTATNTGGITNTASVNSTEGDSNNANNSSSAGVTVTAVATPVLSITLTNAAQLFISWPSPGSAGFALETTTNLAPVAVWSSLTNTVSDNGLVKSVLLNLSAGEPMRFYRLKN